MFLNLQGKNIKIKRICVDSRKIKKGDLFLCYKGVNKDGHNYIGQAIKRGAIAVVGEWPKKDINRLYPNIIYKRVPCGRSYWAYLESKFNDFPQKGIKFIGITGTDGKTTTAHFTYTLLKNAGVKAGLISTLGAFYNDKKVPVPAHTTTPPPDIIFSLLKEMKKEGIKVVVLEVTSHALEQKRVYGIPFYSLAITNITPEHLDMHGNYENYIRAKALSFKQSKNVYLNKFGEGVSRIKKYILEKNKLHLVDYKKVLAGYSLPSSFYKKFPGEYNLQNLSLALSMVKDLGIEPVSFKNLGRVEGRFDRIPNSKEINIIIDFAHTPHSMLNLLKTVNSLKDSNKKIITVFGCAGERDRFKRPKMGEISSKYSDKVILTLEDPRSETVLDIISEIRQGNQDFAFITEPDRFRAIYKALKIAKKGDWVLILGKGHEDSMSINGKEYPWSDYKAVKKALKMLKSS